MTKFKLGFLQSSPSSTDKPILDNTSESSCDGISTSPKYKRFFPLRRKRNNSQTQPFLDIDQGNPSATPPRLVNPLAEVAAALTTTSSKSTSPNKQLAALLFHRQPQQQESPPVGIQASHQTGDQLLAHKITEMTERAAAIEALDSMERYNQNFQGRQSLNRKKTLMEITKQQENSDLNSGINLDGRLSYSHSSASIMASKISGSPPRDAHDQNLRIQFADQRYEASKFRHVLEVLQGAARRVQADQSISQPKIFRSLAPLVIFLYLLGIGVLLPRQQRYRHSQKLEENTNVARVIILFFIGTALVLVVLRIMVWLAAVVVKSFSEADLTQIFRRGECVDVNGRGMGEAELIVGGMFM